MEAYGPTPATTASGALRALSEKATPALGGERSGRAPLFLRVLYCDRRPHGCQIGMREKRECAVAIPPTPTPHLILVEADLALRRLEALFDNPPGADDWRHTL